MSESERTVLMDWLHKYAPTTVNPEALAVSLHISQEVIEAALQDCAADGWQVEDRGFYFWVVKPAEKEPT